MLKGKTVLLGVTGSIAAYKIANLASMLSKLNADIHVLMTKNATNFINPVTFETLTGNKCIVDTFDRNFQFHVAHISLAKKADVVLIAPASANVIAKMANGIADDMLTTTVLACKCKKIVSPAMNTNMYHNEIVQHNIQKLKQYGFEVIKPDNGILACKDVGDGKMPSEKVLVDYILKEIAYQKDLLGKKVIITAGPTQESIDPVRYITNHSTGKMGYELARACMLRGAEVTLVSGVTSLQKPPFVTVVDVKSAGDMFEAMKERFLQNDIIIKAAAVADYRVKEISAQKMKKGAEESLTLELVKNPDILRGLCEYRNSFLQERGQGEGLIIGPTIVGFCAESENLLENAKEKITKKGCDYLVANDISRKDIGFGSDDNEVVILDKNGGMKRLEKSTKTVIARKILEYINE